MTETRATRRRPSRAEAVVVAVLLGIGMTISLLRDANGADIICIISFVLAIIWMLWLGATS